MKGKKKRLLAGTLALLLSCSTLLNTGITALASEQSEEHAQIQEVKQEEAASETLPELEEVKEQLTEEELVYAEDLTIKAGESFDFFDNVNHSKLIKQMWAMGIQITGVFRKMMKK